ncbi:hypothetical protein [Stenotrophomonas sp. PD6]|uniref:hypothetical protein n=1 Tax=Stenotrophomonas sp. PD6 TaxID=3368612 RepID=UPI003B9EE9CF
MKRVLMFPVLCTLMLSGQASALQCQAGHSQVILESVKEHPRARMDADASAPGNNVPGLTAEEMRRGPDLSTTDYVVDLRGKPALTWAEIEKSYSLASAVLYVGYKRRDPAVMKYAGTAQAGGVKCMRFIPFNPSESFRSGLSRVAGGGGDRSPSVCFVDSDRVSTHLAVDVSARARPLGGTRAPKEEDIFIQLLIAPNKGGEDEDKAIIDFPYDKDCTG